MSSYNAHYTQPLLYLAMQCCCQQIPPLGHWRGEWHQCFWRTILQESASPGSRPSPYSLIFCFCKFVITDANWSSWRTEMQGLELALDGSYASSAQTSCISSRHCPIVFIFISMPFLSSVQVWYSSDNVGERLCHLQAHNRKQDWWVQSIQRESQLLLHHYSWYIEHLQHCKAQQHNVVILSSNMATYDFCCYGDFLKAIYLILKYDLPHTTNICT